MQNDVPCTQKRAELAILVSEKDKSKPIKSDKI
jgi:hypothetical protein